MDACIHACSPTSIWLLVRYLYNFANGYEYYLFTIRGHHRRDVRLHKLEWIPNHVPLCALDAIQPQGPPPSRTSSIHRKRYREFCLRLLWNTVEFRCVHFTMWCANHTFHPCCLSLPLFISSGTRRWSLCLRSTTMMSSLTSQASDRDRTVSSHSFSLRKFYKRVFYQ